MVTNVQVVFESEFEHEAAKGESAQVSRVTKQMASGIDLAVQGDKIGSSTAAQGQWSTMDDLSRANEASCMGEGPGHDSFPPFVENKRLEKMIQGFHVTFHTLMAQANSASIEKGKYGWNVMETVSCELFPQ